MARKKNLKTAPPKANVKNAKPKEVDACATCMKDVVGNACIGCDSCERWVHNTEMCSGLPRKLLDAITEHDGSGIAFYCTLCRISRQKVQSSSPSQAQGLMTELIMQLFQQIQGICSSVQALTEQVKNVSVSPSTSQTLNSCPASLPQNPAQQPASAEYRTAIREEIREMTERDKRKHSIIIKGLGASTPRDLALKFRRLTSEVMDKPVEVSEVTAIPNHPQIFRAKILDEDNRNLVLEKAKFLKDTDDYKGVYISRDLTYAQRTALFNRRKAKVSGPGAAQDRPIGGSDAPDADATGQAAPVPAPAAAGPPSKN